MDKDLSRFGGENRESNLALGSRSLVTVDLFKRRNGSFFMRVSLRSDVKPQVITRYELDLDRYVNETEFLSSVEIAGGAIAEHQCVTYGDKHDPAECARAAREAAAEILHMQKITPG